MTFKLGDKVTWTSQAGGRNLEKTGEVIEVVPAKQNPKSKLHNPGMWRNHESYVVMATSENDKGRVRTTNFWPRVGGLMALSTQEREKFRGIINALPDDGDRIELHRVINREKQATTPLDKVRFTEASDRHRGKAQRFYEAYTANSDNLNFQGKQCPTWGELPEAIRDHWCAVAIASELP